MTNYVMRLESAANAACQRISIRVDTTFRKDTTGPCSPVETLVTGGRQDDVRARHWRWRVCGRVKRCRRVCWRRRRRGSGRCYSAARGANYRPCSTCAVTTYYGTANDNQRIARSNFRIFCWYLGYGTELK